MNIGTCLIAQLLKSLPAMQETWVQFLGWEDPLEKEMASHSSTVACRVPWTQEPGGLPSMGPQEQLSAHSTRGHSAPVLLKHSAGPTVN